MKIPLLGSTGEDRFDDVSYQKTQNFYPHINKEGRSPLVLYPTPGLTLFANVGIGEIRGSIRYGDEYYVVSHNTFYRVSAAGVGVTLGTLTTSSGHVSMAHNGANNGKQICIVDGSDLYIWDSNASDFKIITDPADPDYDANCPTGATHVVFMDGFFIINNPAYSGRFNKSAGYDGTTWDALEYATAERNSDDLKSIVVANRVLWLIGEDTAEGWFNAGGTDFPFEPIQSGFSQWGTEAPYTAIEISGITFWLSKNKEGENIVVMATGMQPAAISTPEITAEISGFSVTTDAYAWSYQYQQHAFYVLTFPTAGRTFVYDILTQMWHEWSTKSLGYHRSSTHTFVYNKHLVGDPSNGKIYELDWDKYLDDTETIVRIRRSQPIHGDDKAIRHEAVMLDIREGVGDATTTDPQILLRWRDNNGAWSNQHSRSMGKMGETHKKVVWRNLGRSRERVYKIMVTDPVPAVILDGYARISPDSREIG